MTKDSHTSHRIGGWLPQREAARQQWLSKLIGEVDKRAARNEVQPLHRSVQAFKELIESDPVIYMYFTQMFQQIPNKRKFETDPIGGEQVHNYERMLQLINAILDTAPEFNTTDLVGFPINAVLDWAMGTPAGFSAFLNEKVNACFKAILEQWCEFLSSEKSCYVLNASDKGWLSKEALEKIHIEDFKHSRELPHFGFKSWNDFFTREFKPGKRPVAEPDNPKAIVSACESTPFKISTHVERTSQFWLKSQPYSLEHLLNNDERVGEFVNGTVYQAFLSAYNYHRWHSPVSGTVVKAYVKEGSYYSEAQSEHFDPAGPNLSQAYITQVAARAIIFIQSDDPVIGLMCFVAVGMAEVSSNVITVRPGDRLKKGDELGYFQFGGSTHCLLFRPGVIASFEVQALAESSSGVVKLSSKIATAH